MKGKANRTYNQKLYSNRVTSENKEIHTPPPPPHHLYSKLGCLLSTDFVSDCSMVQEFQLRTFLQYPKDSYLHHPLE